MELRKLKKSYVYILKCHNNAYYTGWTNDLNRRIAMHNSGKGAKYTRAFRPCVLSYVEVFDTKEEALKREAQIKKMTRKEKEELIGIGKREA